MELDTALEYAVILAWEDLVLIHLPTEDQRAEAAAWRAESHGSAQKNSGLAAFERVPFPGMSLKDPQPEKRVAVMP